MIVFEKSVLFAPFCELTAAPGYRFSFHALCQRISQQRSLWHAGNTPWNLVIVELNTDMRCSLWDKPSMNLTSISQRNGFREFFSAYYRTKKLKFVGPSRQGALTSLLITSLLFSAGGILRGPGRETTHQLREA